MARSSTTFAPGQSGNPKGRPRKQASFAELLREELAKEHAPGVTNKERVVKVVVEQAKRGSLPALNWIAERTEGKVPDAAPAGDPTDPSQVKADLV